LLPSLASHPSPLHSHCCSPGQNLHSIRKVPACQIVRGEASLPQPRQCNQITLGSNFGESNSISNSFQVNLCTPSPLTIEFARTEVDQNFEELKNLQDFLTSTFPWVFKKSKFVERSFPNNYSILLRVQGSHETTGDPYLLCAHLDVVPTGERERSSYHCSPHDTSLERNTLNKN